MDPDTLFAVDLSAGTHEFELSYFHGDGGGHVEVFVAHRTGDISEWDPERFNFLRAVDYEEEGGQVFVLDPSWSLENGVLYDVEHSSDLIDWEVIATARSMTYTDRNQSRTLKPKGFYRALGREKQ